MSKPSVRASRRGLLYRAMLLLFACALVGVAAWYATSSNAMASVGYIAPTSTRAQPYAEAWIAKPTYTASPTFPASPVPLNPTIEFSPTPGVVYAEIVPDTATPEYIAYPTESVADASVAGVYGGYKYILIVISSQHLYAYEGDVLVYSFVASTGMNNSTSVGSFSVLNKIPNAYGATWDIWMPNWLGIYWAGGLQNGIHALPILPNGSQLWEGYLGVPISYGCIVLGAYESQLLYDWAEIGTPVEITW